MIAITGATGQLGRLVIENLLGRGVAPSEIVAAVRSPEKAFDFAARGVDVRTADYMEPAALEAAFEEVSRLLLVSSSEAGQRLNHHRTVVRARRRPGSDSSPIPAYSAPTRAR